MGLAKPDNDLVAIRWRAAWLRLERYDRPKIRPGHSLSDLAGGALGRDPLVLRADDHDINSAICACRHKISVGIAVIIDIALPLAKALSTGESWTKGEDCAGQNKLERKTDRSLLCGLYVF